MPIKKRRRLHRFYAPKLSAEEKAENNRYKIAIYQDKMKKAGYRKYQKWVPDEIREEVDSAVSLMIEQWVDSKKE